MQLGHSKDHRPDLPQEKVMAASVDPAAHLVATEVISGQKADDPLYVPIIKRVILLLKATGLLFVGDCKMAALSTRTFLVHREQHYLMPLPETGKDGQEMAAWIEAIVAGEQNATLIYQRIEEGSVGAAEVPDQAGRLVAAGYEFTRQQQGEIDRKVVRWTERVLVVRSLDHARSSQQGLEKRLRAASEALWALTPAPGRGKRQFHDETALQEAAEAILKARRLSGLLTYSYQQEVKQEIRYIGRGRHGPGRAQQIIEHVRYVITGVERQETTITETKNRLGWQAYVTDVRVAKLPFAEAVCVYRGEWRIEGNFQRFKGKPVGIAPIFVHKDDQIRGLTHFLSLAVRFCTLTEYVVRRGLAQQEMTLPGLYEGNSRRETARPTTQRLLKAFDNITLTRIEITGMPVIWHITPLSALQQQILSLLGLQAALYADLVVNST